MQGSSHVLGRTGCTDLLSKTGPLHKGPLPDFFDIHRHLGNSYQAAHPRSFVECEDHPRQPESEALRVSRSRLIRPNPPVNVGLHVAASSCRRHILRYMLFFRGG